MNIEIRYHKCGDQFMTSPQVGVESFVKCLNGHSNIVRKATKDEAVTLAQLLSLSHDDVLGLLALPSDVPISARVEMFLTPVDNDDVSDC